MKPLSFLVLIFCSFVSIADEYHHKNLLVGTNALGYGGAFTAISNDLSAVFYNPAGIALSAETNSASISTFAFDQTRFQDVFSTGDDLVRSSFSIVPSFIGLGDDYGEYKWSLALAVPDLSSERTYSSASYALPNELGTTTQATEFAYIDLDNAVYSLAFGAAHQVNSNLSYGISLISNYKSVVTVQGSGVNYRTELEGNAFTNGFEAARRVEDKRLTITSAIGLLYKGNLVDVGLKLSKELNLSREYKSTHTIITNLPFPLPVDAIASSVGTIKGTKTQKYPTLISVGVAKSIGRFTLSLDVDHYLPVNVDEFVISPEEPAITRDYKTLSNYSLGFAYKTKHNSNYKFGIFTDKANLEIDITQPYQRAEAIDLIGLSMSVDTTLFDYPISVGGYLKYGSGKVRVSDIRAAEKLVGLPLYPNTNNYDTSEATKQTIVTFISANF